MKKKILLSLALAVLACGILHSQDTLVIKTDSVTGNDAMIRSKFPDSMHGKSQGLQIGTWTWSSQQGSMRTLIQFDLSTIPDSVEILSANMVLKNDPLNNDDISDGGHGTLSSGSNQSVLYLLKSAWDQDTVTWNNCPEFDTSTGVILNASDSANQTYYVDITQYINAMHTGVIPNNGFIIKQILETRYAALMFASSEHVNVESRPSLEIVYKSNSTVGLTEQENMALKFFPNPVTDVLNIDFGSRVEWMKVRLTNLTGQEVYARTFRDIQSATIPLDVPSGIYLVHSERANGKSEVRKIVKQ